uniref:J domain-containing protein n=1 Tax=viral metagenome TaxID=1070528 RepID=A0A6C0BGM1_9ZZZZ
MESIDYYEVLGIGPKSTEEEIRKAYKKLALKYHPDKFIGNENLFKNINEAYHVLNDPEKRRIYDGMRECNFDECLGSNGTFNIKDILNILIILLTKIINNKKIDKHITICIDVNLEDIYKAETKKIVITTKKLDGRTITKNIYIPLTNVQNKYIFENQGDEIAKCTFNNIIVKLNIKPHDYVKRDTILYEYDLFIEEDMNLYEYYSGIDRYVDFFDEKLHIKKKRDTSSSEFSIVCKIDNKGLPYIENDEEKRGNLYIYFRLRLPPCIDCEAMDFINEHFNK